MNRPNFLKAILAVVVVFGLFIFPSDLVAQGNSDWAFERVKEVQEAYTDSLMAKSGVVGTAIGSGQGAQPIVLVLVEHGAVTGIPTSLEGVPVRSLVTGKIYALKPDKPGGGQGGGSGKGDPSVDPTARFDRPVPIGVSTGHPDITAGTIGCRVTDTDGDGNKVYYALSNNHVYADENNANIGDAVIQPGNFDGGSSPADDIGTLHNYVIIDFLVGDNKVDAAIALSSPADLGNATPSDGYGVPKSTTVTAYVNQKVKKYGRTTGLTKGQVFALNATVNVGYSTGVALFVNQIVISPGSFSAGGDSGSLVVVDGKGRDKADDRKPVGLLFAGSPSFTIANPIDDVLSAFGVAIDGEQRKKIVCSDAECGEKQM